MQNGTGTNGTNPHKIRTVCSLDVPVENENPGALAGATGADVQTTIAWLDHTLNRIDAASRLREAVVLIPPADRVPFLEAALDAVRPGMPVPPLTTIMAEAGFWADLASRAELKAYALACYQRLPAADQSAFLGYVQQREAA